MRIGDVEIRAIDDVRADNRNARRHPRRNIQAIADSLSRFGQQRPIIMDRAGTVVAGSGTLEAAKSLGWTEIAVVVTSLDGHERDAFAVADNRCAELAEWSEADLLVVLDANRGMTDLGFCEAEIDDLRAMTEIASGEIKPDPRNELVKSNGRAKVKAVISVEDCSVIEMAIRKTEKMNRGEALTLICSEFLKCKS